MPSLDDGMQKITEITIALLGKWVRSAGKVNVLCVFAEYALSGLICDLLSAIWIGV